MKKERLDTVLVNLGYFDNKSKASAAILAGSVKINGEVITKSGFQIDPEKVLQVDIKFMPYVSRGGFKLEKALKTFDIVVQDRICLDAGASTGGFTDCLLQNGAKKVYAVDVGYGQLAWKLRSDDRVKVIEKTNIRSCEPAQIYYENSVKSNLSNPSPQPSPPRGEGATSQNIDVADLLVMDLSFISIKKVLTNLKKLLKPEFHEMICLIKPQFEAGQEFVEKGGVVRDKKVHVDVIKSVIEYATELGYTAVNLTSSPIKGPSGNIEYLVHLSTNNDSACEFVIQEVVEKAFI